MVDSIRFFLKASTSISNLISVGFFKTVIQLLKQYQTILLYDELSLFNSKNERIQNKVITLKLPRNERAKNLNGLIVFRRIYVSGKYQIGFVTFEKY